MQEKDSKICLWPPTLLAEPFLNFVREKKDSAEIESSPLSCRIPNSWASQSRVVQYTQTESIRLR